MNIIKMCCKSCDSKWLYLFIVFIASFVSLLTWLTLATEDLSFTTKMTGSAGAFLLVLLLLFFYMAMCLRRHCTHHCEEESCPDGRKP